jgi:hemerythrin
VQYLSWDSSLSVGVGVIDDQHRRIVDYINDLAAANAKRDRARVAAVLSGLLDYTLSHFAFEEEMMAAAGYPLTPAHRQVHDAFVARIRGFADDHEQGKEVARRLIAYLRLWLGNHIRNDDRDYAPYVTRALDGGWLKRGLGLFFGRGAAVETALAKAEGQTLNATLLRLRPSAATGRRSPGSARG